MTVVLSRHIFGTVRGYQTLAASADVTDDERRLLESFSFGQTDSRTYLESLVHEPSYWSRPLPTGRRAITRVLPGAPDDQGRATLLFVTVLLSNDAWVSSLTCDDTQLLTNTRLWEWDGAAELGQLRVRIGETPPPAPSVQEKDRILSLLEAVERESAHPTTTIVGGDGTLLARDISLLVALLPHDYKPQFSYAVRSLSDGLPVHVNGLAECASRGKSRRRVVRWSPNVKPDPLKYTKALSFFWRTGAEPPWTFVANCKSFGEIALDQEAPSPRINRAGPAPAVAPVQVKRGPAVATRKGFPVYALVASVLVLLIVVTPLRVVPTFLAKGKRNTLLLDAQTFLQENPRPESLTQDACEREELAQQASKFAARLTSSVWESGDEEMNTRRDAIDNWRVTAKTRCDKYKVLDGLLNGFHAFRKTLGLDSSVAITEYPTEEGIRRVHKWRERLEEHESPAEELGESYPVRITAALKAIDDWKLNLDKFVKEQERSRKEQERSRKERDEELARKLAEERAEVQKDLARLSKELTELRNVLLAPPTQLQKDSFEDWESYRDQLDGLREEYTDLQSSASDERDDEIRQRLVACQKQGALWKEKIDDLQSEFETALQDAQGRIKKSNLDLTPPVATLLRDSWDDAIIAKGKLERAFESWPSNDEAAEEMARVMEWLNKAAQSAFEHFKSEVDSVEGRWETWRSGGRSDPVEPGILRQKLTSSLTYWDNNRDIIEYHDPRRATDLYENALAVEVGLKEVAP